jgi:hypothetical protein
MSNLALIERMLSYDVNARPFDGYPSINGGDDALIDGALEESASGNPLVYLCFLASQHAETPTQYRNAKDYIDAYVESVWDCNMAEECNSVHRMKFR